jgi:hypothetical protein
VSDVETLTPTETREERSTGDGDAERFAHYCRKADVTRAYITGEAIVALCGKRWVPSRDPSRYPICPTCKSLKEAGYTFP